MPTEQVTFELHFGDTQNLQGPFSPCAKTWRLQRAWHVREMVKDLHFLLCRILVDGTVGDRIEGQIVSYPIVKHMTSFDK